MHRVQRSVEAGSPYGPSGATAAPPPPPAPGGASAWMDGPPPPPVIPAAPIMAWPAPAVGDAVANEAQYRVLWRRYFAYAVDGAIVQVPAWLVHLALHNALTVMELVVVSGLVVAALAVPYYGWFWSRPGGATPGMRLLRLVMGPAEGGGPIPVPRALVRVALLQVVVGVLTALSGVGAASSPAAATRFGLSQLAMFALDIWMLVLLVTALTSPRRQALHDRVAGTVVSWAGPAGVARWTAALAITAAVYIVNFWLSLGPLRGL